MDDWHRFGDYATDSGCRLVLPPATSEHSDRHHQVGKFEQVERGRAVAHCQIRLMLSSVTRFGQQLDVVQKTAFLLEWDWHAEGYLEIVPQVFVFGEQEAVGLGLDYIGQAMRVAPFQVKTGTM